MSVNQGMLAKNLEFLRRLISEQFVLMRAQSRPVPATFLPLISASLEQKNRR